MKDPLMVHVYRWLEYMQLILSALFVLSSGASFAYVLPHPYGLAMLVAAIGLVITATLVYFLRIRYAVL